MKVLVAVALSALIVTPAIAASGKKKMPRHHQAAGQVQRGEGQPRYRGDDAYTVRSYGGSRVIGRDPDPNVRQSLRSEDALFRRGEL